MKTTLTFTGNSPLLMHNERLANPLDPHAQALKSLTSKRSKTDEDFARIARTEWEGGLYWSVLLGPFVPAWNLKRMLIDGGKLNKLGLAIERYVGVVDFQIPVVYDGPRDVDGMFAARMYHQTMVGNQGNRVLRTRPQFVRWQVVATFDIDAVGINPDEVVRIAERAGSIVGLGDGRKIGFGKFSVTAE